MTTHRIPDEIHRLWSTAHRPALDIASGDALTFDAPEVGAGQDAEYENGTTPPMIDPDLTYPLLGPVMVEGAEPGDVIELEILDYVAGTWGGRPLCPEPGS